MFKLIQIMIFIAMLSVLLGACSTNPEQVEATQGSEAEAPVDTEFSSNDDGYSDSDNDYSTDGNGYPSQGSGLVPLYNEVAVWGESSGSDITFRFPNGIAIDADDNVYITEFQGNRVQKISPEGELLIQWGSTGSEDGQFLNPTGIAIDSDGNIYVSESGNHRVQKFTADGKWLLTFGGQGTGPGEFISAMVLAIDVENQIYVTDWGNGRVQVFDALGTFLGTISEVGVQDGMLVNPTGIKIDHDGNVWVVDRGNNRVQKFTIDGRLLAVYGSQGENAGQFLTPTSINFDAEGNYYVSEVDNSRVQIFNSEGQYLGEVATDLLQMPHGLAFDSTGVLYITDTGNNVVRKLKPSILSQSTPESESMVQSLPERSGPRTETTGSVPHTQIGVEPVPEVNDELYRLAFALPGVESRPTIVSLPGAIGMWLVDSIPVVHPEAIVDGREFAHIHPDGSLHAPLPFERALEVEETGWGERHPWADQRDGWEGLVMLYTPQSFDELEVTFQLIVESYNFVTGQSLDTTDFVQNEDSSPDDYPQNSDY